MPLDSGKENTQIAVRLATNECSDNPWAVMQLPDQVRICRGAKAQTGLYAPISYPFTKYFSGFDQVDAVRRLFGDRTKEVLDNLCVQFASRGYMRVSSKNGHLWIGAPHLNTGRLVDLYLDIIHELVHVKQWMEGHNLRDRRYPYLERPTELEAFRYTVAEARRLGLTDRDILVYLHTERMSERQLRRLACEVNVVVPDD
jgi:hypothetical protein